MGLNHIRKKNLLHCTPTVMRAPGCCCADLSLSSLNIYAELSCELLNLISETLVPCRITRCQRILTTPYKSSEFVSDPRFVSCVSFDGAAAGSDQVDLVDQVDRRPVEVLHGLG